jgi:hypothetical protein
MIAKAIPMAYAQPIYASELVHILCANIQEQRNLPTWKIDPKAGSVLFRKNEACDAIPG